MTTDVDAYFAPIRAQIKRIPRDIALEVAQQIYEQVTHKTRIDSGQAALNWFFEPYEGDHPAMRQQEMLWGYQHVSPTTPAGYKHTHGLNDEGVMQYQFEYMANQIATAPEKLSGVYIYNPITPGFTQFSPGDDTFYELTALGSIDIDSIAATALSLVESTYHA